MATWHTIANVHVCAHMNHVTSGVVFFFFFLAFFNNFLHCVALRVMICQASWENKEGERERERDDLKGAHYTQVGTQYSLVIGHSVSSQDYNWQFPAHLAWPWWLANVLLTLWQICPAGWFDLSLALLALENTRTSLVPRPSRVFPRRTLKNTGWPGYKATLAHHRWTFYAKINNIFH